MKKVFKNWYNRTRWFLFRETLLPTEVMRLKVENQTLRSYLDMYKGVVDDATKWRVHSFRMSLEDAEAEAAYLKSISVEEPK